MRGAGPDNAAPIKVDLHGIPLNDEMQFGLPVDFDPPTGIIIQGTAMDNISQS